MNTLIHKYQVPQPKTGGLVTMKLPRLTRPLYFDFDGSGVLCLWAQCSVEAANAFAENADDHHDLIDYLFINTGEEFETHGEYEQTVLCHPDVPWRYRTVVWHIFRL